jgi:predicted outer membrane repeat protein
MVTLTGINFGSPFDATTVNFYQNETVTEGFLFKTPSIETELFVRIPSTLTTGICTTRVSVLGDSLMTSWPFSFNVKSVPDGPVLRKVYKNFGSGWVAVNTITAEDTILVSGYGIDTNGGTVFLSKDGKMLQGTNLATQSDPVFGIAPQVVVPTGLGTGQVEITVSTVVNGTESELSDKLVINYIDNYVFVNSSNSEGPWLGTEESPYNNIQAGIDAVSSSGTVLVSNGTYLENINFIGKGIKLGSLYMTTGDDFHISSTIIDGNKNGSVVSFINNEDTSSVLTGFTIQNGSGTLIDAIESHGGGIYCKSASPYLKNLNIIENSATHLGGGIYCSLSANPIISDIIISGNKTLDETTGQGGGLFVDFLHRN